MASAEYEGSAADAAMRAAAGGKAGLIEGKPSGIKSDSVAKI